MLAPPAYIVLDAYKTYGLSGQALAKMTKGMTGYDPAAKTFAVTDAVPFWTGMVAAIVVHKVAARTVNKYIPKWIPVGL